MNWFRLLCLGCLTVLAGSAAAQLPPDKVMSTFTVADGLEITLWASEPLFVNPTCMDIDSQGRVWVCDSVNYRTKSAKRKPNRPAGDRIVILEDTKGTGKADKATIFAQSEEILAPLGIALARDPAGPGMKVFVCQSPDILVFEDRDGDGKADGPPTKLLSGFRGVDHDRGVHGIFIGPDGKLYFTVGDQGVSGLVDRTGKKWSSNTTDCRAGSLWRCNLDGTKLELLAHNFRNPYEACADSFGNLFTSDNDDDNTRQTRICQVLPGGNYGYNPRGPGQSHWHEEQPGVVPKILPTGAGAPAGMCVYEGSLLPKKYQGQLLHTDAGARQVRCYGLTPAGAGYRVERSELATSTDTWFRPCDVCVAPDGSVFIADWYDPAVGGHGMGDTTRGRIYRLAPRGNKPSVPKVDLKGRAGLTAGLASPALSVRHLAMAQLDTMDPKAAVEVLEAAAVQKDNVWLRARALWQLGRRGRLRLISTAFFDPDPRLRALAIRILKEFQDQSPADYIDDWRTALLNDSSAAVRREALIALRDVDPVKSRPLILELARKYDGKDRFYLCAIGIAVGLDNGRRKTILAGFLKEFPGWSDQVANLIWELRPAEAVPRLEQRLADATLPADQRSRVVDLLGGLEALDAGKALLKALTTDLPPAVRDRCIDQLRRSLPLKWRNLRPSRELSDAIARLLEQADGRTGALTLIGAAERDQGLSQLQAAAEDPKASPVVRFAAIEALGLLPSAGAGTAMATLLQVQPPVLREEVVRALGRQAQQTEGRPAKGAALKTLQDLVRGEDHDLALRQAAVAGLGVTRPGTAWLLQLNDQNQLPKLLRADVARVLRNHSPQDLRGKANAAFPPPRKLDPKQLPGLADLAARRGNARRGLDLLTAGGKNDLQCLKCHVIAGAGGHVGPDLTRIGAKASRASLFESLLDPSKVVAEPFRTHAIETRKGQVISGVLVQETDNHVILRDVNAKDIKIAQREIEARAIDPRSLMPQELPALVTDDNLVDVVEYLCNRKTPVLGLPFWYLAGPFDNGADDAGLDRVFPPEQKIDLQATYTGKAGPVAWQKISPNVRGYVDLRASLAAGSDNAVSYLHRRIVSPADQDATIRLGTDGCAKLWLNGMLVYVTRKHRPARPEEDSVPVRLKKGPNTLLLKLSSRDRENGFFLSVASEQELKAAKEK